MNWLKSEHGNEMKLTFFGKISIVTMNGIGKIPMHPMKMINEKQIGGNHSSPATLLQSKQYAPKNI